MTQELQSDRYRIERRLGEGGMGVVYAAHDTERDRLVALKTLGRVDAAGIYRLKQEFRSLADVAHPNLVALHDLVYEGEQWFFTMELVDGADFVEHVRRHVVVPRDPSKAQADHETLLSPGVVSQRAPAPSSTLMAVAPDGHPDGATPTLGREASTVPEGRGAASQAQAPGASHDADGSRDVVEVVDEGRLRPALLQLAEAVVALHAAGKLHRDLKPSNILVDADGRVVVLDFGLVQEVEPDPERSGDEEPIAGTPGFMAPEQVAGERATEASDWYAFGVVLFMALTGELPFQGNVREVLSGKLHMDAPAPSTVVSDAPPDLDDLCVGLLRRDPLERLDAGQVLARLRAGATGGSAPRSMETGSLTSGPTTSFFGREAELTRLEEHLADTRAGATTAVLLAGRGGMGKTMLLDRFLESQRRKGDAVVLAGRCFQREAVPYKAFDAIVDGLSRYLRRLPASTVDALLPRNLNDLVRVFPVLSRVEALGRAPRLGRFGAPETDPRPRAFAALRELLARMADRFPVIIAVDDLHWGDRDSGELLLSLLAGEGAPALLFVGAYREERASQSELLTLLGEESREPLAVRRLELGPLAVDDAFGLAMDLLGAYEFDSWSLAKVILREANGVPLLVAELARHVASLGADADRGAAKAAARVSLDELIERRLESVTETERAILELVAVAEAPLDQSLVARVLSLRSDGRLPVAKLRAARLLATFRRRGQDVLELPSEQVASVLLQRLGQQTRRELHGVLAKELARSEHPAPELLAHHHREAGQRAAAATAALDAAERACAVFAWERAARFFEVALDLGEHDGDALVGLAKQLADALVRGGRVDEAVARLEEVSRNASPREMLALRRCAAELQLRGSQVDALFDVAGRGTSLFDGITRDDVEEFLSSGAVLEGRRGDVLVAKDGPGDTFHVVLTGVVGVESGGSSVRFGEGEVLGGTNFVLRAPRTADVRAMSDSVRVLELGREALDRLAEKQPSLALQLVLNLSNVVCSKLVGLKQRLTKPAVPSTDG